MKSITLEESETFKVIDNASNLCLVKGTIDEDEVAVVSLIEDYKICPLAILLTDEMRKKLRPDTTILK